MRARDGHDVAAVSSPAPAMDASNDKETSVARRRLSDAFVPPQPFQPVKTLKRISTSLSTHIKVPIGTQPMPGLPMPSSLFDELKSGGAQICLKPARARVEQMLTASRIPGQHRTMRRAWSCGATPSCSRSHTRR
jgi:hypothetical protein|eukprot:3842609-Prymnesium_polylepis.1